MTFFPSHSFEQYYQSVRRCWRFGQTRPVVVDIISTQGEANVLGSLRRKAEQAERMFAEMVAAMNDAMAVSAMPAPTHTNLRLPAWLPVAAEVTA